GNPACSPASEFSAHRLLGGLARPRSSRQPSLAARHRLAGRLRLRRRASLNTVLLLPITNQPAISMRCHPDASAPLRRCRRIPPFTERQFHLVLCATFASCPNPPQNSAA